MDIMLNFINNSNDANSSQVVIFQKNVADDFGELAVAWKVIQNCGKGDTHPFAFPNAMQVGVRDSYGNATPLLDAHQGQRFALVATSSGHQLLPAGAATNPGEVQVINQLGNGAINASIYKDGRLLATKTSIAPQQAAVFQVKPTLWIGLASQVVEGQVMNSAIVSDINTELSVLGIASANIVMTGGGPDTRATPYAFTYQNVVWA